MSAFPAIIEKLLYLHNEAYDIYLFGHILVANCILLTKILLLRKCHYNKSQVPTSLTWRRRGFLEKQFMLATLMKNDFLYLAWVEYYESTSWLKICKLILHYLNCKRLVSIKTDHVKFNCYTVLWKDLFFQIN